MSYDKAMQAAIAALEATVSNQPKIPDEVLTARQNLKWVKAAFDDAQATGSALCAALSAIEKSVKHHKDLVYRSEKHLKEVEEKHGILVLCDKCEERATEQEQWKNIKTGRILCGECAIHILADDPDWEML